MIEIRNHVTTRNGVKRASLCDFISIFQLCERERGVEDDRSELKNAKK